MKMKQSGKKAAALLLALIVAAGTFITAFAALDGSAYGTLVADGTQELYDYGVTVNGTDYQICDAPGPIRFGTQREIGIINTEDMDFRAAVAPAAFTLTDGGIPVEGASLYSLELLSDFVCVYTSNPQSTVTFTANQTIWCADNLHSVPAGWISKGAGEWTASGTRAAAVVESGITRQESTVADCRMTFSAGGKKIALNGQLHISSTCSWDDCHVLTANGALTVKPELTYCVKADILDDKYSSVSFASDVVKVTDAASQEVGDYSSLISVGNPTMTAEVGNRACSVSTPQTNISFTAGYEYIVSVAVKDAAETVDSYTILIDATDRSEAKWQIRNANPEAQSLTGNALTFTIGKEQGAPVPQSVKARNASTWDNPNGAIIGADDTMEYRLKGSEEWLPVPEAGLNNLPCGTYELRVKETGTACAGEVTEFTVGCDIEDVDVKLEVETCCCRCIFFRLAKSMQCRVTGTVPEGYTLVWEVSEPSADLEVSQDGLTCLVSTDDWVVTRATVTVKLVNIGGETVKDSNGNEIKASSEVVLKGFIFSRLIWLISRIPALIFG